MKDLCIIYHKDNKSLTKKLVAKLESDGITCWVAPRDFKQEEKESLTHTLENSKILLLIIDKNSARSKEQMDALEIALDHQLEIIPFVVEKIESSLYSENFFYTYSWVDAYEDSFDDAYEVLIDAYEDLSGEKKGSKKKQTKKGANQPKDSKTIIYVIAAILLVVIGYFIYDSYSESEQNEILVGQWHLSDYHDNLRRTPQDSVDFIMRVIPTIKQNALLIFNEDHTFERRGFTPEPQIGKWTLNDEGTQLYLEPHGATASTDKLNIQNLTENSFTIVVDEVMPDSSRVNTRLTFTK
ncbi:MAG: toll/interleukin-1 receptor domain-containing protein [Bacteroidales bacterium]|nr:toll/interleukin-1 receptor domain-containing protein [Bacteroidales bacterium]